MARNTLGWCSVLVCLILSVATNAFPQSKTILIVAPHPDDEALIASGIISAAKAQGDTVKVVVVTNGDYNGGVSEGYAREAETVTAMENLGLAEQDVIFLGYGARTLQTLYQSSSPTTVYTSAAGQTQTYADRGLGGVDYHTYLYGSPGPYNQQTILGDFEAVLKNFAPSDIYTTSYFDADPDNKTTYAFLTEALIDLKRNGTALPTTIHASLVNAPCAACDPNYQWPAPAFTPEEPFPEPPFLSSTPLLWNQIERVPVPTQMLDPNQGTNLKYGTIADYPSQTGTDPYDWLYSFVKKDEFFWDSNFATNIALTATVTVSSENTTTGQLGSKAIDGIVDGYPGDYTKEWATNGQLDGAWIRLTWPTSMKVSQVVLHDRPNSADNVLAGTLSFSDGSSVSVGALPNNGAGLVVNFTPRTVTWVQFQVTNAVGYNIGLSEIEVYGVPATSTTDHPPQIYQGPVATPTEITDIQTSTLSVNAFDVDGDPLQYTWTSDGGTLTGSGPSVVFTPPTLSTQAVFTITVTVSDGRGGTAQNSQFITVIPNGTPAVALSSVRLDPASVSGGGTSTGTVILTNPAPSGGATISLSSNNTAAATVPASVTVPGGVTSASFSISTSTVSSSTPVTISASYGGSTQTASLTVNSLFLSSLSLSPTSLVGGNSSQGTVTLNTAAPTGGAVVALSSNNVAATVPSSVTIPAGANSATFAVTTAAVTTSTQVTISASYSGLGVTALLLVNPPAQVSSLLLNPTAVYAGNTSQGTVTLGSAAPAGGAVVTLSSSNPSAVTLPASVTVPAGSTNTTFAVTALSVSAPASVTISASYGGVTKTAALDVELVVATNLATSASVTVSSENTSTGQLGIKAIDGIVDGYPGDYTKEWATVGQLAGAWIRLTWSSSQQVSQVVLYDRPNLTDNVLAGTLSFSDGSTVSVGALPNNGAGLTVTFAARTVTWVQFQVTNAVGSNIGLAEISVLGANAVVASSVSLNPSTVVGGGTSQGTVTLSNPAPTGGAAVALSSGNASSATVPASVTVPAGATSATFTVTTSVVTTSTPVTISGTYGGVSATATLTVIPSTASSSLTLNPSTVLGGSSSQGTVTLDGSAPAGGTVVTLSSNNTSAATVPASVTVPAGATSATFTVTASSSAPSTILSISATSGGVTKKASLTVLTTAASNVVPQTNWSLEYVDSQETSCMNGAAVNAFDGNPSTIWETQECNVSPAPPPPHVIEINLGASYILTGFTYLPRQDGSTAGMIGQYQFFVSTDGVHWGAPVARGTFAATATQKQVSFAATVGQYIRLDADSEVNGNPWTSVAELNVLEMNCSTIPAVRLAQPQNYSLQSSSTLAASAQACLNSSTEPGWGVRFELDGGTAAGGQQFDVHTLPFQGTFTGVKRGEHTVDAYIIDSQGNIVSGTGTHDQITHVGIGDFYVAMGDSISYGFGDTVASDNVSTDGRVYGGGYEPILNDLLTKDKGYPQFIMNEAVPGATSADGLALISSLLQEFPKAQTFLIMYGMDDARPWAPVPSGEGLSPGDPGYAGSYKDHMQQIIDAINQAGKSAVLAKVNVALADCADNIPSDPGYCAPYSDLNTGARNVLIQQYNTVIDELASDTANKITVVPPDFYTYFESNYSGQYSDNIHPNGFGYQSMATLWDQSLVPGSVTVSALAVTPTDVVGGNTVQGTVTLSGPAPAGGTVVLLSSGKTSAATVPASVTVPAGSTSATFSVTALTIAAPTPVTISASYGGLSKTASVNVELAVPANLATSATVTVSSEDTSTGQLGIKAIDGIVDGYPGDYTKEWATTGQLAGAWIRLTWASSVSVSQVILYDRPNLGDNVLAGTLSFSDGSTVTVGALPNNGAALAVTFATRKVTWVQFQVTSAVGSNIGLAEISVLGPTGVVVSGLTLNPTDVIAGGTSQGTVTLSNPAPTGGALVTLSSNNTSAAAVPSSITVPAGSTSANFTVTAGTITAPTPVTISATYGGAATTATANVELAVAANLATSATVTVSSQNTSTDQLGIKAIDGIVDGYPGDYTKEWATTGQLAGAWIRLTWASPVSVSQVILYDRPNLGDNVLAGTLSFSDGSTVTVGALPNNGAALAVTFATRKVTWVQFQVTNAVGSNIGLAEISVQ